MSWYSRVQGFHTFLKKSASKCSLDSCAYGFFQTLNHWVFFIWSFLKRCWTIRLMLRWFYAVSSLQQCGRRSLFPRVSYLTTAVFYRLVGVDILIIQLSACGPVKDKLSVCFRKRHCRKIRQGASNASFALLTAMFADSRDYELRVLSVPAFTNCRKGIPILKEKKVEVEMEVEEVTVLTFRDKQPQRQHKEPLFCFLRPLLSNWKPRCQN